MHLNGKDHVQMHKGVFFMIRKRVIVLAVLAFALCLGGCTQGMPKAGEPGQPYPEDGYGGYSNANPNLIMNPPFKK